MRRRIISLLSILLVITALSAIAVQLVFNHEKSGFRRSYTSQTYSRISTIDLQFNSYYFAGHGDQKLYLGNLTAPLIITSFTSDLNTREVIQLSVSTKDTIASNTTTAAVTAGNIWLLDRITPAVLRRPVNIDQPLNRMNMQDKGFYEICPVSETSIIAKLYDFKGKKKILGKRMSFSSRSFENGELLDKQIDGKFCMDGQLRFDEMLNRLVYLYYYRNQFVVFDTNLSLIAKYNTIDTVTIAKIALGSPGDKYTTFTKPPLIINKSFRISKDKLFVQSARPADNDIHSQFRKNTVLDVYEVTSGKYLNSISIPNYRDKKLTDFFIRADTIYTLYESYLSVFVVNRSFNN